jgi:cytochrome c553
MGFTAGDGVRTWMDRAFKVAADIPEAAGLKGLDNHEASTMKRKLLLDITISIAVMALIRMPVVVAAEGSAKPDLAHAKQVVDTVCAACHGADGNSVASANPNLAGQGAEYITRQLQNFKSGVRANPVMTAMAATLTPEDMVALGIYFSQQKAKAGSAKDPALLKAGQALYRGGLAASGLPACSSCHSPNGAGIPKNYPRLAGQFSDYTYAQLKAFKDGVRGADKDGHDVQGKVMSAVAQKMGDEQMKALAEYTAGLR